LCAVNVGQGITIKGTEIGVGILGVWGIQMWSLGDWTIIMT
jgi:hypothetical protein